MSITSRRTDPRQSSIAGFVRGLAGSGIAAVAILAATPAGAVPPGPDQLAPPPPPPPVTISIDDVTDAEGTGGGTTPFVFTISLSRAADEVVSARVIPVDGTAHYDEDWIAESTDIEFSPGETEIQFVVDVVADDVVEDDEVFAVMVEQLVNVEHGDTEGLGTILDDEPDAEDPENAGPGQPGQPGPEEPTTNPANPSTPTARPAGQSSGPAVMGDTDVHENRPTGTKDAPVSGSELASVPAADPSASPSSRLRAVRTGLLALVSVGVAAAAGLALLRRTA